MSLQSEAITNILENEMVGQLFQIFFTITFGAACFLLQHYSFVRLLNDGKSTFLRRNVARSFDTPLKILIPIITTVALVEPILSLMPSVKISKDSILSQQNLSIIRMESFIISLTWGFLSLIDATEKYFIRASMYAGHKNKDARKSTIVLSMKMLFTLTLVIGLSSALQILGIETARGMITLLSVTAAAIGFASRDLLSSIFGTIKLYMTRAFTIGDRIKIDQGIDGRVENITWFSTCIRLSTNALVYVPNIKFLNMIIENKTSPLKNSFVLLTLFSSDHPAVNQAIAEVKSSLKSVRVQKNREYFKPELRFYISAMENSKTVIKIIIIHNDYTAESDEFADFKICQHIVPILDANHLYYRISFDG